MNLRYGKIICSSLIFMAGLLGFSAPTHAQKELSDAELIKSLKKGGYVIYLRHAATDVSKTDQNREDLSDWNKQRNLSALGRKQAVTIGEVFRALAIPVSDVISSPYCRCIETGKLAFGKVRVAKYLAFSVAEDKDAAQQFAKELRTLLATQPAKHGNTVVVSHSGNLQDAAAIFPKPEGVMMIFQPKGNDAFEFVQRVEPDKWPRMAEKAGARIDTGKLNGPMPTRAELCASNAQQTN